MNENQRIQANHFRNAVIEECARRLDMMADVSSNSMRQDDLREAAAAIRALKDKP